MSTSGGASAPVRVLRPQHVAGIGLLLSLAAVGERLSAWRGGRYYVFCHASSSVDRITYVALCLVLTLHASSREQLSQPLPAFSLSWCFWWLRMPSTLTVNARPRR